MKKVIKATEGVRKRVTQGGAQVYLTQVFHHELESAATLRSETKRPRG